MDLKKLGTLIHNKRVEVGMPLATAAKRTDIGRSTLLIIEAGANPQTGKPSRPGKDILERLAVTFHMSQTETEELLSLADYTVARPATGQGLRQLPSSALVVSELNGTVYYAYNGYLGAIDAQTGQPRWPKPVYMQITADEAARPLPREEISPRSPGRQASKRQRVRETEPLSPEKGDRIAATGLPASQPTIETGLGAAEVSRKKKRQ